MNHLPVSQGAKAGVAFNSLRSDARRNRTAILVAANVVFADSGGDAGMDRVAARAGVGVGTIYRHFSTKEVLLGALLAERYVAMRLEVEQIAARPGLPFERMAAGLRANGALVQSDPLARQTLNNGGPAAHEYAEPARRALEGAYAPLLKAAHEDGSLRIDFVLSDIGRLMTAVCATMDGDKSRHWRHILAIVIDGLRTR